MVQWGEGGAGTYRVLLSMIDGWISRITKTGSWREERCVYVCVCVWGGGGVSGHKSPMRDGWIFKRIKKR